MSRVKRALHPVAASALVLLISALWVWSGEAHKPITSPFTFHDDVFPILRSQCGRCHMPGGVAPMSLLTHEGTVPWGESIRAELLAGHMPPWSIEGPRGRFQNAQALTARELDVLLTWVSGGTPPGDAVKAASPPTVERQWPLGPPDVVLTLPEYTLAADQVEARAEFTIPLAASGPVRIRAADILPGRSAIVRSAVVRVSGASPTGSRTPVREQVLASWVPGDHPVALDGDATFFVPAGAEIAVAIDYRKTWEYEREVMSDRSAIGLYFAPGPAPEMLALALAPDSSVTPPVGEPTFTYSTTIDGDVRALAIYPDAALADARVIVTAARPDGSREELIAFRPKAGWARRYWFTEPVALPRGTTITVRAELTNPLLPPGAIPAPPVDPSTIRLTLNVVPAE